MRPHQFLLSLLTLAANTAYAQGVVNKSLLAPPTERAVPTWTTTTFEQVQAAVVFVAIEVDGERDKFLIKRPSTGIVVDASGLVLTFHHLVKELEGATDKRLFVQLNDAGNTELDAKVVAHDVASGLVLLKVAPPADGLQVAKFGSDRPDTGEPVLVISRPEGKDMLAFAGVASNALSSTTLDGKSFEKSEVFLTDSRNDERCDGGAVFGADGCFLGLFATEHVKRDVRDAKLEDLQKPSFGVVVPAGRIRAALAKPFAKASNATLQKAPQRAKHRFATAVAKVAPSIVGVCSEAGGWPKLGPKDPGCVQRHDRIGSAVVLTKSGLVVCNAHVCRGDGDLQVKIGGKLFAAEVVKQSRASNLALLQVDLKGKQLQPAECAPDDDVDLGEAMLAVARPLGTELLVSGGVISAMRGREGGRIQADANLGNQNGGGAVIDAAGRVIGICDAGREDPIARAFRMRGEVTTKESNLSTFLGIRQVRKVFRGVLDEEADLADSIMTPVAASVAQQQARRAALRDMVKTTSGAMLNIYVARNIAEADPDDPFPPEPRWMPMSLGSGVIIDRSGLAVSNWHVVDSGVNPDGSSNERHRITARVFGGKEYEVRVLSISREDDLSLLQLVLEEGEEVYAVELGNSETLGVGESVAAIGNPHGRANTITYGVVSAKGQGIRVKGRFNKLKHVIETDAAINGGNSGGALLDMDGRLVGINSAGGGTFNNVGYSIAVDHVRSQLTGLLMSAYKLRSVDLGMRLLDEDGEVAVMDVDERGPAALAGVQSGDRITSFAGTAITWSPGFAKTLALQTAGTELPLEVDRAGQKKSLTIKPMAPEVWGIIKQSGMLVRDLQYAEDPDRVRLAAIALHRAFTGDKAGAPRAIPEQAVVIERVFAQDQGNSDMQPGDLLLAIEFRNATDDRPVLEAIDSAAELRDIFSDRLIGKTKGKDHYKFAAEYKAWVARGNEVLVITVRAKRLFW